MAFLRNSAVNLLNLHYGVRALAQAGGGAFFTAFLLHAGLSPPVVLASLALILAGRFLVRPFVLAPTRRWGLKPMVIAGALLTSVQYPLLAQVHGVGPLLFVLCLTTSAGDAIYWTTYHAYFASLGDPEHRGHQLGAREALVAIVGIIGPLVTGWALTALGAKIAFGASGVVLALSILPMLGAPNIKIAQITPPIFRSAMAGMLMFFADGWISAGLLLAWQIALFVSLGENFTVFGGAMALAALAGAIASLLLGRLIDAGHGMRAVWLSAGSLVFVCILRAASSGRPVYAVVANAAGALLPALYTPTLMTAVYNQAKTSPCPLRFQIIAEGGWDAGGSSACLTAAGLLWAGAPISTAILLGLVGALAVTALLRGYYGATHLDPSPHAGEGDLFRSSV